MDLYKTTFLLGTLICTTASLQLNCFTGNGDAYRGTIATTGSGKVCQSWASQSPHNHNQTPKRFPDGGLDSNYCRNPDNERMTWCYTVDPVKRWEYCDIPDCTSLQLTCFRGNGDAYRGTIATTGFGRVCQSWASQSPHNHDRTPERFHNGGLESNYCRNPDNDIKPWCYTVDRVKRWEYCDIPDCTSLQLNCFTGNGDAYRGTIATTVSGNVCQSWASQSPHNHKQTPKRFPDGGLESNYCRNPDNERMPWCYTVDPVKRWDYCSISRCSSLQLNCFTGNGDAYRGTIATTVSRKVCQSWASQSPHNHDRTPDRFLYGGLDSNYCRNPDNERMPWCYTVDPQKRWEYCDIPDCTSLQLNCFTDNGAAYRGTIDTTGFAKVCQSWASQSPHNHDRTPERFPDGGLDRNYCRNPDNEMMPWCYTVDPNKRWEYCDISRCLSRRYLIKR